MQSGYYSGGSLSSNGAYDTGYNSGYSGGYNSGYSAGYAQGVAKAQSSTATVTYTVKHVHGAYCKPSPSFIYHGTTSDMHSDGERYEFYGHCSVCGNSYGLSKKASDVESEGEAYYIQRAEDRYKAHLTSSGECPYATITCGKAEGTRTTTNTSTLGAGDTVISAVVNF